MSGRRSGPTLVREATMSGYDSGPILVKDKSVGEVSQGSTGTVETEIRNASLAISIVVGFGAFLTFLLVSAHTAGTETLTVNLFAAAMFFAGMWCGLCRFAVGIAFRAIQAIVRER